MTSLLALMTPNLIREFLLPITDLVKTMRVLSHQYCVSLLCGRSCVVVVVYRLLLLLVGCDDIWPTSGVSCSPSADLLLTLRAAEPSCNNHLSMISSFHVNCDVIL